MTSAQWISKRGSHALDKLDKLFERAEKNRRSPDLHDANAFLFRAWVAKASAARGNKWKERCNLNDRFIRTRKKDRFEERELTTMYILIKT